MVKWIIRSVNYDNEGELYKVVKDAIDSGNIDGLTPQLEHFTFVRLDSKYSILRHDYIYNVDNDNDNDNDNEGPVQYIYIWSVNVSNHM